MFEFETYAVLPHIFHSCIVISKALALDGSLHYVQRVPYAAIWSIFLLVSIIRYCSIQLSAVSKRLDVRDVVFAARFRYQLIVWIWSFDTLYRLLHAHVAYEIDTAKIIAVFYRIFYCLCDLIR